MAGRRITSSIRHSPRTSAPAGSGLQDPYVVQVTVSFTFLPFFAIPPIPAALPITRESWFAVSDLTGT